MPSRTRLWLRFSTRRGRKRADHKPGTTIHETIFLLFSLSWADFLDKLYGTGLDSSTKVKSGVWERSPHNGDTEGANGADERAAKLSGKKDPHPQTSGIRPHRSGIARLSRPGSIRFSYRGSFSDVSEIAAFIAGSPLFPGSLARSNRSETESEMNPAIPVPNPVPAEQTDGYFS